MAIPGEWGSPALSLVGSLVIQTLLHSEAGWEGGGEKGEEGERQ